MRKLVELRAALRDPEFRSYLRSIDLRSILGIYPIWILLGLASSIASPDFPFEIDLAFAFGYGIFATLVERRLRR